MKFSKKQLKEMLKEVELVAQQAGEKLIRYQKQIDSLKVSDKEAQGVVSKADIETEQFIMRSLKKRWQEISFLGEESSFQKISTMQGFEKFANQTQACWIIDPLDGTTNFLTGLDYFAVCIALYSQGELLLGVVHRPQTAETFLAAKGCGAWKKRDGKRKKIVGPTRKTLLNSVLATGFSSEKGKLINQEFRIFKKMMNSCRGIRRMGSAALDMCLLAEGQFSGFWERGLAPWDIAAAGIICQEAGVILSDWQGKPFSPFISTIMGGEKRIIKEFRQILMQS